MSGTLPIPDLADGSCRAVDPDSFFKTGPGHSLYIENAKNICSGCPVRVACLEYAITSGEDHGIWGGLTEDERYQLKRQLRRRRRQKVAS